MKHVNPNDLYKSSLELRITEEEREGLINLANEFCCGYAEPFAMWNWNKCIRAKLNQRLGYHTRRSHTPSLGGLFIGDWALSGDTQKWRRFFKDCKGLFCRDPRQASQAIINFLMGRLWYQRDDYSCSSR